MEYDACSNNDNDNNSNNNGTVNGPVNNNSNRQREIKEAGGTVLKRLGLQLQDMGGGGEQLLRNGTKSERVADPC